MSTNNNDGSPIQSLAPSTDDSLIQALAAAVDTPHRCIAAKIILKLSDKDREAVYFAVDRGVSKARVASTLTKAGYRVSREAVRIHFAGDCSCSDKAAYPTADWADQQ